MLFSSVSLHISFTFFGSLVFNFTLLWSVCLSKSCFFHASSNSSLGPGLGKGVIISGDTFMLPINPADVPSSLVSFVLEGPLAGSVTQL